MRDLERNSSQLVRGKHTSSSWSVSAVRKKSTSDSMLLCPWTKVIGNALHSACNMCIIFGFRELLAQRSSLLLITNPYRDGFTSSWASPAVISCFLFSNHAIYRFVSSVAPSSSWKLKACSLIHLRPHIHSMLAYRKCSVPSFSSGRS